ncbi:MAG TPA: universal stress protein [Blastocatellia bacterium]|nr:universal stress protein [Blastocatellia bacterium]
MSINTILVATDFSEHSQRAFEVANDLARQTGAKLCLLHVQTENALRTAVKEGLLDNASTNEEIQSAIEQLTAGRFAQVISGLGLSDVSIEKCSRRGDADAVIPAYAKEIGADLLIVGRRGAGLIQGVRSALLGSVTDAVIRKSPCPVMVVRREHTLKG